jgi:dTMP kinase
LDALQLDFYQRVRQGYFQLVNEEPERWVVIDAMQPFEQVQQAIRQVVVGRLIPTAL